MVPSGIDKEKLMLQVEHLEEHLSHLNSVRDKIKTAPDDSVLIPAAERLFQLVIQDCLNIGSHLIVGFGLKRADTYREVFTKIKEAGILSEGLGEKMEAFASFRNRLVHIYWEVSKAEVISELEKIDSFKKFAQAISDYSPRKQK